MLLLLFYGCSHLGPVFKFIVRMAGVFAGRVDPVHTVAQYLAVLATEADVAVRVEPGDVGGEVLHVHRPVLTVWTFIINTLLSWKWKARGFSATRYFGGTGKIAMVFSFESVYLSSAEAKIPLHSNFH